MGQIYKLLVHTSFTHTDILAPTYSKISTRNITIIIIKIITVIVIIKISCNVFLLDFSTLKLEIFTWTSPRLFAMLYTLWEFWSHFSFFFLFVLFCRCYSVPHSKVSGLAYCYFRNILFRVSNLIHLFIMSLYIPLHVSSHIVLIIRRFYCICTASCSLCIALKTTE